MDEDFLEKLLVEARRRRVAVVARLNNLVQTTATANEVIARESLEKRRQICERRNQRLWHFARALERRRTSSPS
jgi:hypothetical protein